MSDFLAERHFAERAKSLKPYAPIEPPWEIAARLGIEESELIKLDANENPFGCPPGVSEAIAGHAHHHVYPDPSQRKARRLLADHFGRDPERFALGAGADEVLDLLCRLFLNPGDRALSFTPTFSYYPHLAGLNGAVYETLPRNEGFGIDRDALGKVEAERYRMVFLCSPNNPSGNPVEEDVLEEILGWGIPTVLDEAYADFGDASLMKACEKHANLIVVRTFSKLFGMAGLRLGFAYGSPEVIAGLMAIKPPYSITTASEVALEASLGNFGAISEIRDRIVATRESSREKLNTLPGVFVYPSQANFLLLRLETSDPCSVRDRLESRGILVRRYAAPGLEKHLRVSVGTPAQMNRFINILPSLLS